MRNKVTNSIYNVTLKTQSDRNVPNATPTLCQFENDTFTFDNYNGIQRKKW